MMGKIQFLKRVFHAKNTVFYLKKAQETLFLVKTVLIKYMNNYETHIYIDIVLKSRI